nr:hypothetical protein [Kineosporia sp. R_H_3]
MERGVRATDDLPAGIVLAAVSLGVLAAPRLAKTRPGAAGAPLLEACGPTSEFGTWTAGVPAQVHGMDADPFFTLEGDVDAARALVTEADDAEPFVHPGQRHLFSDSSLASYDAAAAALLTGSGAHLPRAAPPAPDGVRADWPDRSARLA